MEELIARIIEQSIVSGGFLLLLHHVIMKQEKRLEEITGVLTQMNKHLMQLDNRLKKLEKGD